MCLILNRYEEIREYEWVRIAGKTKLVSLSEDIRLFFILFSPVAYDKKKHCFANLVTFAYNVVILKIMKERKRALVKIS